MELLADAGTKTMTTMTKTTKKTTKRKPKTMMMTTRATRMDGDDVKRRKR